MAPRKQMKHRRRLHTVKPRTHVKNGHVHVGPGLKKAIKKIARGPVETKYIAEDDFSNVVFNSVITGTTSSETYRAIPLLSQGIASYQRIGKKINPVKANVHLDFRFDTADANSRDITVVLFMYQIKADRNYGSTAINPTMSNPYTILDNGNGQNVPFNGIWQDANKRFNTEDYVLIHKKKFRLNKASGLPNGSGVIGQYDARGTGMYSDVRMVNKNLVLSVKPPKTLSYDDPIGFVDPTLSSVPDSFAPVFVIGYYYNDGTDPDTAGGILKVACRTEMWFKDA